MPDKQGTVALDELKDVILDTCKQEIEIQKVGKKDIEAFLSSFVYNSYGHTDISKIAPQVFEQYSSLQKVHWPLPPPSFVDEDILKFSKAEVDSSELIKVSNELVTKIFVDRKNHYTIFKSFD